MKTKAFWYKWKAFADHSTTKYEHKHGAGKEDGADSETLHPTFKSTTTSRYSMSLNIQKLLLWQNRNGLSSRQWIVVLMFTKALLILILKDLASQKRRVKMKPFA